MKINSHDKLFYHIREDNIIELVDDNSNFFDAAVSYYGAICLMVDDRLKALNWYSQLYIWYVWLIGRFYMSKSMASYVIYAPMLSEEEEEDNLSKDLRNHRLKPVRSRYFQNEICPLLPLVYNHGMIKWAINWLFFRLGQTSELTFKAVFEISEGRLFCQIAFVYWTLILKLDFSFTGEHIEHWSDNWWDRLFVLKNEILVLSVGKYKGYYELGRVYGIKCWAKKELSDLFVEGTVWWRNWIIKIIHFFDILFFDEKYYRETYKMTKQMAFDLSLYADGD